MGLRIVVATSAQPFSPGGSQILARELTRALAEAGHRAELWTLPQNRFGRQGAAYAAAWLSDLARDGADRPVDRVISLRFPAYAVRHPRHVVWLCHRMREYYDLWPEHAGALAGPWPRIKETLRRTAIRAADQRCLTRAQRVFTISDTVGERLRRWGGIASETLRPPAPVRRYRSERAEPFILAVSRLHRWKRPDLLLEALARARTPGLRAVLAGDGPERAALAARAAELGIADRVEIRGQVGEDELVDLYARCLAVCFAPLREDYGFVTVEAFASGRPVVTCRDSGGPAELVEDGVSGRVVAPEPGALAAALDDLAARPEAAAAMGERGLALARTLNWPAVVARLVDA